MKVHLEFLRQQAPSTAAQWLLVGLLCATALSLTGYGIHLEQQVRAVQANLQQAEQGRVQRQNVPAGPAQTPAQLHEALQSAERVSRQLNIPWDRLFSGLEASHFKDMALLEIQPDAAASKVRITAEARHQDALRDYMKTLWALEDFSSVYLVRQKINDKVAENPVQFTLEAHWNTRPPQ